MEIEQLPYLQNHFEKVKQKQSPDILIYEDEKFQLPRLDLDSITFNNSPSPDYQ